MILHWLLKSDSCSGGPLQRGAPCHGIIGIMVNPPLCLAVLSCDLSLITMHIWDCCQFSDIHISQGSVATYWRCGGIFKYEFVANLPLSVLVKEFWKSVNIWGSYGQEFSVLFFWDTVYYSLSVWASFTGEWVAGESSNQSKKSRVTFVWSGRVKPSAYSFTCPSRT